jgi:hypothetical protein
MKALFASVILAAGLMSSAGVYAKANIVAAPAGAPAGATGLCKDGTYTTGVTKQGGCKGHKGIQDWYAAEASVSTTTTTKTVAPAVVAAPAVAATTMAPAAPAPAPASKGFFGFGKKAATPAAAPAAAPAATTTTTTTTVAAGGGAGQVWVNTSSKVYHCPNSRWYGKTKAGSYMTESAALAAGAHADHGKACK